jgi:hypothetical protein
MHLRVPALLAIALIASGCAAVTRTGVVSQPTPVPWIATKPASMLLPTPTPAPIRPGTQTCQASDIKALLVGTNAATGGQLTATIALAIEAECPAFWRVFRASSCSTPTAGRFR